MKEQHLPSELSLELYNEIPVLTLTHTVGVAKIALQGAQLLSWKPKNKQDVFWLSHVEPFKQGSAIRGGVPICYPWFGNTKQPPHGTARLRLWYLSNYDIQPDNVQLTFSLFSDNHLIEAKITMSFNTKCELMFTHYRQQPAQVALHSYFNISDIEQISVQNLPSHRLNKLTEHAENNLSSTLLIREPIDSIYPAKQNKTILLDPKFDRCIQIFHKNASDIVVWNPWENTPSAMQPQDYRNMVCIETARVSKELTHGESMAVEIAM